MRGVTLLFLAAVCAVAFRGPTAAVHAQVRSTAVAATSGAELRAWDATVDRMLRDDRLRRRRVAPDELLPGRTYERLDQYYNGVRVYGGDIARQLDNELTLSVFGTVYSGIDIDVSPSLSPDDVRGIVEERSGVTLGADKVPELVVLPDDSGGYRLTFHLKAFTQEEGREYFVDAKSGAIVRELIAAERQSGPSALGRGLGVLGEDKKVSVTSQSAIFFASDMLRPPSLRTFDMKGDLQHVLDFLNGVTPLTISDVATSSSTTWSDPVVVDAHADAGYVYDFYFKRFGRHGLDDNNLGMLMIVHPVRRQDISTMSISVINLFYLNAFYAGGGVMVFGEGLPPPLVTLPGPQSWNFLAGALDVLGHELTHGVTEFTSNLIPQGESGALNEAFSDMMGTAAEFFYQPIGDGLLKADYLIGEDVVTPGGIRSLADPGAFGDPDHYSRRFIGAADNGGVHTNSTIASHAYYLSIEGGTNRTSGLSVQGVGVANREQIEKTFYRGFTQLMPSNATFSVASAVTIQAARDLYGAGSAAERAVTQAWAAVGVN
jgi:bacillolysin